MFSKAAMTIALVLGQVKDAEAVLISLYCSKRPS
jgi:hypothetical protein